MSDILSVSNPEKIGDGIGAYTRYTVKNGETVVQRRFKDFQWLYEVLVQNYKGAIVPPAPEKTQFGKFEEAFLRSRCRSLSRFLRRIVLNSELAASQELHTFLTADETTFAVEKTLKRHAENPSVVADTTEQVGFWFSQTFSAAGSALSKGIKQVSGEATVEESNAAPVPDLVPGESADSPPWENDPDLLEFSKYEEFAHTLEAQLSNVARHATQILVRQREWAHALKATGEAFKGLSDVESDRTSAFYYDLSFKYEKSSGAGEGTGIRLMQAFVEPLQDAARFVKGIKVALQQRSAARKAASQAANRLKSRTNHFNRLRSAPDKIDRVQLAEAAVKEAEELLEQATESVRVITERLRENMTHFKLQYMEEIKTAIESYADLQVKMTRDMAGTWEEALGQLGGSGTGSSHAHPAAPTTAEARPALVTETLEAKGGDAAPAPAPALQPSVPDDDDELVDEGEDADFAV